MIKLSSFLILALLTITLLISSVSAEAVPDPYDTGLRVYIPHNTTDAPDTRIANSTYLIHFDPGFPVEWFAIIVTLAGIFFFIMLYGEKFNDLAGTLSTVLFYITSYMSQFLSYHDVQTHIYSDYIVIVPVTEVYHLDFLSYLLFGFASLSLLYTVKLYWDHWKESAAIVDKKRAGFYQERRGNV